MRNSRFIKLSIIVIAFSFSSSNTKKWGFQGHKIINRMAVFTLPVEIGSFYKKNIEYITKQSTAPDSRRYSNKNEGSGHFIDIEFYEDKHIDSKNWTEVTQIITEDTLLKHGILPWRVQQYKYLLQSAFEKRDVELILKYSSEIGHYIADAHVPLHTTKNYNGQYTNQRGIHALWETYVVDLIHEDINYFTNKVFYIDNIKSFIWNVIYESNNNVAKVLKIEKEITNEAKIQKYKFKTSQNLIYTTEFIKEYNLRLNGMVEIQLKKAILSIGSIWYTAWIDAGQPKLEISKVKLKAEQTTDKHDCNH